MPAAMQAKGLAPDEPDRRTVGWFSQWKEMLGDPQSKIGRPRQLYIGEGKRDYVTVDKR